MMINLSEQENPLEQPPGGAHACPDRPLQPEITRPPSEITLKVVTAGLGGELEITCASGWGSSLQIATKPDSEAC